MKLASTASVGIHKHIEEGRLSKSSRHSNSALLVCNSELLLYLWSPKRRSPCPDDIIGGYFLRHIIA